MFTSPPQRSTRLSRRGLLAGGLALGVSAVAGCGSSTETPGQRPTTTKTSDKAWSFTDDRDTTARAPQRPSRLVAQASSAAALWDLGLRPVGVFGEAGSKELLGDVDVDAVTWVGKTWGEFNLEAFAALRPDLLVTPIQNADGSLWYVPQEHVREIESICPIVAISYVEKSVAEVIDRYVELAESLGVDVAAESVTSAREAFQAASTKVSEAARAKPGLRVAFLSATDTNVYIGNADVFSDLRYLRELGVRFVEPSVPAEEPHWEVLSWEQVDKYPIDLLLYDSRNARYFTTGLDDHPTLANLPAVKAGQIAAWNPETPTSWKAFAPALEQLADTISKARPGLAS
ncbi:ABC transporter substrate-binding protein [Thermasporomyces composti]|uniref:Iron complex transport system substrate-binding protein n=1 Tax=Thermasporomyces composti TaxID=696763 RepID=A0A3D9VDU4_THECX|nr:ABC transporter substrate-binding protein [Thermasporomyces composti]REF35491.1 iron complex transport system substrate-binding protein [Thermasporomyces composti]